MQLGLIDAKLVDSINGLSTMRILAAMDQHELTEHRVLEFANLAAAIEELLRLVIRPRKPDTSLTSEKSSGRPASWRRARTPLALRAGELAGRVVGAHRVEHLGGRLSL